MAIGKVSKVLFLDEYQSPNGIMYNHAVLFEGDKTAYMISGKEKDSPKAVVGENLEYNISMKKDNPNEPQIFQKYINGNKVDCTKIAAVAQNKLGGGGGGNKRMPKTVEEYSNDMISYVGGYVTQIMTSRHNLAKDGDPSTIVNEFKKIYDPLLDHFRSKIK